MRFIFRWLVLSLTILMLPKLVPGVQVAGFPTALAAAAVLSVLNVLVRPLFILLTLPLTVMTLGLFLLVVNGLMFQFASTLVSGMVVESFSSALLSSFVVSFVSWVLQAKGPKRVRWRYSTAKEKTPAGSIEMHQKPDGTWE
jgi:putative membrane protein